MSEAPRARTSHIPARFLVRVFLLVLGTLAFFLLLGPRDARALDVGPVGGAVDQVAQPGGAVDRVVDDVGQAANQLVQQVDGIRVQVNDPVRDLFGGAPPTQQVDTDAPNRHPGQPPISEDPAAPPKRLPNVALEPSSPNRASLSQPTRASDTSFPAGSPGVPVGPSSASMSGLLETGGRGLPLSAAFLAAALALAVALSRWLRLSYDARAPNPFLSRVEVPG